MESLLLMGIANILKEAFKIFNKNRKVFASIALFTLLINSIQFFSNIYSIKSVIADLVIKGNQLHNTNSESNPEESANILTQLRKDFNIFIGLELIYFTIDKILFLLTTTATILAAASIYGGKANDLSFTNLLSRTVKSWLRPLVTWLFTFLFGLVFFFIFALLLAVTCLVLPNPSHLLLAAIPLAFLAIILYIYLSVNWNLAIVISAVEKTKGIEAIGKAGEIIEGMKLKGFLIHLLVSVIGVVLWYGIQLIGSAKLASVVMIKGVVVVSLRSLLNMYHFAVFTVIYYMCKKNHGERVELEEESCSSGYSMVATTIAPVVDDQLP